MLLCYHVIKKIDVNAIGQVRLIEHLGHQAHFIQVEKENGGFCAAQ